ncbi:MAG TPA: sulfurtransferase, partial [Acidimicrobiales bacterium]|nr:sulfurtransferase [Acidimicrobiales bacterium]
YVAGHIPGAVFVDLDSDLAAPPGAGGRHPLPPAADAGASLQRLGVTSSVPVVCYDGRDSTSAARCWWMLSYYGHTDVSLLDGGYANWVAAGGAVETGWPEPPPPGDFLPEAGHRLVLSVDEAAHLARAGVLLDARAGERYRGEIEPFDAAAGHIPGALSAPTLDNVEPDGRWRRPEELRARFAKLGLLPGSPSVGAYCGSGVTAAHELFALELAGIHAALYVGSWSQWCRDSGRPVATGADPG